MNFAISHLPIFLVAFFGQSSAQNIESSFSPHLLKVRMEEEGILYANFTLLEPLEDQTTVIPISVFCDEQSKCEIANATIDLEFSPENNFQILQFPITVRGKFIGYSDVVFRSTMENVTVSEPMVLVAILRSETGRKLSVGFTTFIVYFILVATFSIGTQLNLDVIIGVVKKPIGPTIGLCCQFVIMPVLSFFWAWVLLSGQPALQFGLFAAGCSPGGGNSNFWTILLEGNPDLSVTMTLISKFVALGAMPAWLLTLGRFYYPGEVAIPLVPIIKSIAVMAVPLSLGMVVGRYKPQWKKYFNWLMKFTIIIVIIVFSPFALYANLYVFRLFTWRAVIAGAMLPYTAFPAGYVAAFLLGQNKADRMTIAIETAIQNVAIGILVARLTLPEPDSDLMLVMPAMLIFLTTKPLYFAYAWLLIRRYCLKKKDKKDEENPAEITGENVTEISTIEGEMKEVEDVKPGDDKNAIV